MLEIFSLAVELVRTSGSDVFCKKGDGSNDGTLVNENLFTKLFIISFVSGIMEVCDYCKEFVGYVLLMVFQHWKQKNNRRVLGCLSYHHLEQMRDCL